MASDQSSKGPAAPRYMRVSTPHADETGQSSVWVVPACGEVSRTQMGLQSSTASVIRKFIWVSNETVVAPRFQMHSSEVISLTQRDGRNPESSLESV